MRLALAVVRTQGDEHGRGENTARQFSKRERLSFGMKMFAITSFAQPNGSCSFLYIGNLKNFPRQPKRKVKSLLECCAQTLGFVLTKLLWYIRLGSVQSVLTSALYRSTPNTFPAFQLSKIHCQICRKKTVTVLDI